MSEFKFGAKLKLFGQNEITIQPNPEFPHRIEYHDTNGIAVTKKLIVAKLNIKNEEILSLIPDNTRVTDFVVDTKTEEAEIGIVITPGADFILNRYKNIIEIDEVSLYYNYAPEAPTK